MLKTTGLSKEFALKAFRADTNEVVGGDGGKANKTVKNSSKFKKFKNEKSKNLICIGATGKPMFLTPGARKAFNHLKQVLIKAPILRHFDLESHIWIETDVSG